VLATQNPIEHEGTYPLPEAQLDRFMLRCGSATRRATRRRNRGAHGRRPAIEVQRVAEADDILAARSAIAELFMDQKVVDYIVDASARLVAADDRLAELKPLIAFGASPRASIYRAQAARAHAYLRGRAFVVPEDVKAMAFDVLRHRILLTFEAEAEDMNTDQVITKILEGGRRAVKYEGPERRKGLRSPVQPRRRAVTADLLKQVKGIELRTRNLVSTLFSGE